jgi:spore maturation protein CgeB
VTGLARRLEHRNLNVAIGGSYWQGIAGSLPSGWFTIGPKVGAAYINTLRQARICLAPVQRRMVINGVVQPGDQDSARTYELAAANCFFMHLETDFVRTLYDPLTEVPLYRDVDELAAKIEHFLPLENERRAMAAAAHRRATPAYSMDARAAALKRILESL